MDKKKVIFIIQARMGSTRFPGKVLITLPSAEKLIDVIIHKAMNNGRDIPVVVATSDHQEDDLLAGHLADKALECFRGPLEDVLERFIQCAEFYNASTVIRVCADNPFIDIPGTVSLLDVFRENEDEMAPGLPSIKSHIGLWGEVVTLEALKRASYMTAERVYHEHVTNFIYSHPEHFRINFQPAPGGLYKRLDIRLTLDDRTDLRILDHIVNGLKLDILTFDREQVIGYIDKQPELLHIMKEQMDKYNK